MDAQLRMAGIPDTADRTGQPGMTCLLFLYSAAARVVFQAVHHDPHGLHEASPEAKPGTHEFLSKNIIERFKDA